MSPRSVAEEGRKSKVNVYPLSVNNKASRGWCYLGDKGNVNTSMLQMWVVVERGGRLRRKRVQPVWIIKHVKHAHVHTSGRH